MPHAYRDDIGVGGAAWAHIARAASPRARPRHAKAVPANASLSVDRAHQRRLSWLAARLCHRGVPGRPRHGGQPAMADGGGAQAQDARRLPQAAEMTHTTDG